VNAAGKGGWVPEVVLMCHGEDGMAWRGYDTRELSVSVREAVTVGERLADWAWVTNATGDSGWVPEAMLDIMHGGNAMAYQCQMVEQPAQHTLLVRSVTSLQNLPGVLQQAYGATMQYLGELGVQPAGEPFAAYYNLDMQALDVEAGFPVPRQLPGRGNIVAGLIPAGKVATCLHVGPYDQTGPAYEALNKWIADNGYEATGVVYEFYLNDPRVMPPQEPRTRIVQPLKQT
jgi:effector-binding domain-containing protein